jgi:hypothetical protein
MSKTAQGFSLRRTFKYAADEKPAENKAHRQNSHLGLETINQIVL